VNTKEKIAVMQAFLDGKKIQWTGGGSEWSDFDGEPIWNWLQYDYRIKPEPREFLIAVSDDGTVFHSPQKNPIDYQGVEFIKVREVL
jgi:hypothetical protein